MESTIACVLCDRALTERVLQATDANAYQFTCATCGKYWIDGADQQRKAFEEEDIKPRRYRLSALTKAAVDPLTINRKTRDELRAGFPRDRTVLEKVDLVFRWCAGQTKELGRGVVSDAGKEYPVAWCKSPTEWLASLRHLANEELITLEGQPHSAQVVNITLKGWRWLAEQPKASGAKVFIAMAFDSSLNPVKATIETAIRDAGYEPLRVDDDHYAGGVMERIVGHVRDSKFIVADFTRNRGGVYYEAGAAFGLGIPVVHLCAEECLGEDSDDKVHFDIRHLNFITWKFAEQDTLKTRLRDRIIAIFGRGPRSPS